jgi:hypothetical protein
VRESHNEAAAASPAPAQNKCARWLFALAPSFTVPHVHHQLCCMFHFQGCVAALFVSGFLLTFFPTQGT